MATLLASFGERGKYPSKNLVTALQNIVVKPDWETESGMSLQEYKDNAFTSSSSAGARN